MQGRPLGPDEHPVYVDRARLATSPPRWPRRDGARGEDLPSPRQSCIADLAWMRAVRPRRTHRYEACRAVNVYVHGVRCHSLGRADLLSRIDRAGCSPDTACPSRGLGAIALLCVSRSGWRKDALDAVRSCCDGPDNQDDLLCGGRSAPSCSRPSAMSGARYRSSRQVGRVCIPVLLGCACHNVASTRSLAAWSEQPHSPASGHSGAGLLLSRRPLDERVRGLASPEPPVVPVCARSQ